ncbi:MAG: PIG-L deacetylase family protein [Thermofilum sp.]
MPTEESGIANEVRRLAKVLGAAEALRRITKEIFESLDDPFKGCRRVLCIQPHPDDCEYGAGATLAELADAGVEITYLTLTDGSKGTLDPSMDPRVLAQIRRLEQERAAKVVGVKKLLWLDYLDGELPYSAEVRSKLIEAIRAEKPDVVFAPDPYLLYEAHPDHRVGGLLALEAAMFSPLPLFSRGSQPHEVRAVVLYYTARPNLLKPVDRTFERKLQALKMHESQFSSSWNLFELYLRVVAAAYGAQAGSEYAEAFRVLPTSLLHATALSELV